MSEGRTRTAPPPEDPRQAARKAGAWHGLGELGQLLTADEVLALDAEGLAVEPGLLARARAIVAARPVSDVGPAMAELGKALTRRMTALGLPVTGDVERDLAGFERHCRASEQVGIGARAHVAQDVLPALDRAMQHGPQVGDGVVLDGEVVRKLRQLAFGAARLAERLGTDEEGN